MSLSYIIATYAGKNHSSNGDIAEHVLSYQMTQLLLLLENKVKNKIDCIIKEVIIVKPKIKAGDTAFDNYYLLTWECELLRYNISLIYVDYIGDNTHYSYDQWIQGWMASSSEYVLLIEDDYCLDANNFTVDIDIVSYYQNKFKNNIGYLSSGFWEDHAAISNGILSRDTLDIIKEPCKQFYAIGNYEYIDNYRSHKSQHAYNNPQIVFSNLFIINNIPIDDFRDTYKSLFWASWTSTFTDFSLETSKDSIFIPIQKIIKIDLEKNLQ